MAPDDQTVVVLELPCQPDEDAWERSAGALQEAACDLLEAQGLATREEVVAFEHHALPFAYPILDTGAEAKAEAINDYLQSFENLHLLGRSAGFTYTHVHNLYANAKAWAQKQSADARSTAVASS